MWVWPVLWNLELIQCCSCFDMDGTSLCNQVYCQTVKTIWWWWGAREREREPALCVVCVFVRWRRLRGCCCCISSVQGLERSRVVKKKKICFAIFASVIEVCGNSESSSSPSSSSVTKGLEQLKPFVQRPVYEQTASILFFFFLFS